MKKSKRLWRTLLFFVLLAALCGSFALPTVNLPARAAPQLAPSTTIVINQIYGGGGNSGATYKNDFIELHNMGASTVSLNGWSVQYASAGSSTWSSADKTDLSGSIAPGQYYLIQEAAGGGGTTNLPAPDTTGSIVMSASAGKVALVNTTTLLSGSGCPLDASIVDFIGYGAGTNCSEGTAAPAPSNTNADIRNSCVDTDNNSADFTAVAPSPRNSSSALSLCMDPLTVTAVANLTATASAANLTATASAANLTATVAAITSTASAVNATGTASAVNATNTSIALTGTATPTNTATVTGFPSVLINEVAWSGTAANSSDEWIELYNPGSSAIDITGWQLYGDDNIINRVGSPNISLNGTIPAGGYFLLERDEQATDVPANQVYSSGDLLNTGERLYLKDRAGNTVDTPNLDGGAWPAGTASSTTASLPAYASMERVGTTGNQWVTYQGTIAEAHNRNGGDIKGTPGSANWIRTASVTTITSDLPDPSVVNQNVTVRVTVVGGTSTPTGTVTITGANTNCTLTLVSGTGSCIVKFTSVGSKTLTAVYHSTSGLPVSSDTESHQVITSGTIYRTPTPIPPPPPQLIAINEFVPRPGHDWNHDGVVNVGDEYIELLNHGTVDVNLSGWRLDDEVNIGSNPYSLPSKVLKPGERIVFFGSQTGLLLGDGGDAVRLLKPNGQLIDAYNYTVVRYPDQSYCRLPDNGGADDWNQNCFPTPGLQNSLSGNVAPPSTGVIEEQPTCPIADTLPQDFVQAECDPFGDKIWRPEFWDRTGWYGEKNLPSIDGKWPVFAD